MGRGGADRNFQESTLRRSPSQAKAQVAALGESVGRWRAEQKVAAAAAWLIS
jgi:hypothetical protein